MAQKPVELRDVEGDAGDVCRRILDLLPSWFGIPEANDAYVQTAGTHPSVIASIDGDDVGITTIKHHSPYAAEVYLMAVMPHFHRAGIGTAMLRHLEDMLAAQGVEFLQVKTLSAARPDIDYDKTRAFYLAYGFRPLEEFPTLWDPSNPALQLIKAVPTDEVMADPSANRRSDEWTAGLRSRFDELLDDYRASLHDALDGLTEEEARLRLVPSKTTLLGLVQHVTYVEGVWFDQAISGRSYAEIGIPTTPVRSFTLRKNDTIASVQAAHRQRCDQSRRTMAAFSLDAVVDGRGRRPVWALQLQVLRELAQHAGHADILREQILDRRRRLAHPSAG